MEQPSASSTLGDTSPIAAEAHGAPAPERRGSRATLINLIPPLTLLAVVLFWGLIPESLVEWPWTLTFANIAVMVWIQGLEFFFERHEGWRLNKREFFTDVFYVILFSTAIAWAAAKLGDEQVYALKESLGIATPWLGKLPYLVQAAMVFFLFEFGQYWMHRAMHDWRPLWLLHAPHHHITQLNALKGYVGNPLELFLISLSIVALFDFSTAAVLCSVSLGSVVSGFAHANVRSDPPAFYSFFCTTIRHHSLHHTALSYEDTRCNYGNSLIVIDRIFGTYREGESSIVGQDDRKRLSIPEQFMFPLRPLIDAYKAKRGEAPAEAGQV